MPTHIDNEVQVVTLLDAVGKAGAGEWFAVPTSRPRRAIQAVAVAPLGTNSVTASVVIEASNDAAHALPLATIDLNGVPPQTDGVLIDSEWVYVRARVANVDAGASVTVTMGI